MREKYKALIACCFCFTLLSCSQKTSKKQPEVAIIVVPMWQGQAIDCNAVNIESTEWQIRTLAFFMSNIAITHKTLLEPDSSLQQNDALRLNSEQTKTIRSANHDVNVNLVRIDRENCHGKVSFHTTQTLKAGDELSFDLGVPFAINHLNPVTQPSPLNEPDMFWTWRNGYKFFRLDMNSKNDNWAYHLGSVGCVSESAVRAPKKVCAQPNLTRHSLKVPEGESWRLVLHLDKLLTSIDATRANRCVMHGDKEPTCAVLLQNLNSAALHIFTLESY